LTLVDRGAHVPYVPTDAANWMRYTNYRERRGGSDSDSESDDSESDGGKDRDPGNAKANRAKALLAQGEEAFKNRDNLAAIDKCKLALFLFREAHGNYWNAGAMKAMDTLACAYDLVDDTAKARQIKDKYHRMTFERAKNEPR